MKKNEKYFVYELTDDGYPSQTLLSTFDTLKEANKYLSELITTHKPFIKLAKRLYQEILDWKHSLPNEGYLEDGQVYNYTIKNTGESGFTTDLYELFRLTHPNIQENIIENTLYLMEELIAWQIKKITLGCPAKETLIKSYNVAISKDLLEFDSLSPEEQFALCNLQGNA